MWPYITRILGGNKKMYISYKNNITSDYTHVSNNSSLKEFKVVLLDPMHLVLQSPKQKSK